MSKKIFSLYFKLEIFLHKNKKVQNTCKKKTQKMKIVFLKIVRGVSKNIYFRVGLAVRLIWYLCSICLEAYKLSTFRFVFYIKMTISVLYEVIITWLVGPRGISVSNDTILIVFLS